MTAIVSMFQIAFIGYVAMKIAFCLFASWSNKSEVYDTNIKTWSFPYHPGYHFETPISARDAVVTIFEKWCASLYSGSYAHAYAFGDFVLQV